MREPCECTPDKACLLHLEEFTPDTWEPLETEDTIYWEED